MENENTVPPIIYQLQQKLADGTRVMVAQKVFENLAIRIWPPPPALDPLLPFRQWANDVMAKHPHPDGSAAEWVIVNELHPLFFVEAT